MNLKHIKNQNNKYTLYLFEEIGGFGISGKDLVQDITYLESAGIKELDIRINSGGGSVLDGYSIISKLIDTDLKTTAYIDGIAASIAGVIALACDTVIMADYALFMLHNPHMNVKDDKEADVLDKFRNSILKIFLSRTNLDKNALSEMMNAETWLDAEEALKIGFVDSIYRTNREEVVNKLQVIYNSLQKINDSMENTENKEIEEVLDTVEEVENTDETTSEIASDAEVSESNEETEVTDETAEETSDEKEDVAEVETLDDDTKDNDPVVTELLNEIETLKEQLKVYHEKEASLQEEMINKVLEPIKNKLTEEEYSKWFDLAKTDLEFVKNSITKFQVNKTANKITDSIEVEESSLIDVRKMEKENPKKLAEIKNKNYALYKASFEKSYGISLS